VVVEELLNGDNDHTQLDSNDNDSDANTKWINIIDDQTSLPPTEKWEPHWDEKNETWYYYNPATKETTWVMPDNFVDEKENDGTPTTISSTMSDNNDNNNGT